MGESQDRARQRRAVVGPRLSISKGWRDCQRAWRRGGAAVPLRAPRAAAAVLWGSNGTTRQEPGQTDKTDVPVQPRKCCESAMRGHGYGTHIGRSATSPQLTGLPPVSSPLCVECTLKLLKGASAPRASSQVSRLYVFESIAQC